MNGLYRIPPSKGPMPRVRSRDLGHPAVQKVSTDISPRFLRLLSAIVSLL